MDFLSNTSSLLTSLFRRGHNYATKSGHVLCWACTGILLIDPEIGERKATAMEDLFYGRRLIREQSLGSYRDISSRQFCPMCRLVSQLLSNDKRLLPSNSSPAASWGACVIQQHGATPVELRLTYLTGDQSQDRLRQRGKIVVLSNECPLPSGSDWGKRTRFTEYCLHTHQSARSSELLDIDFVRYCLASCEQSHTSCSHPETHETSGRRPADILLINVQEECLEHGTTSLRYLALSYVWGDGRFYKTRGKDVPALQKHGSLASSANHFGVPRTVRDAMVLAKQLGEKYLWVDALCIIQDDDGHKTQQLRLMDRIYRHSVMTVIAMSGGDARSGLPGVGSGLRRRIMPIESIEGEAYSLTIEPPHLRHVVHLTAWSTRAWTFQEQLLSRRCLYLSDWQAYFQCQATTVGESMRPQDDSPNGAGVFEKNHSDYSTDGLNPLVGMTCWDDGYTSYQTLVGYYLRRRMTRESDILHAFEGISAFMQAQLGGSFFAGVPEAAIDFCLLWAPVDDITRRRVPGFYFPSWSWAGWKGITDQTWHITFLWDTLGVGLSHVSEDFLPYWPEVLRSEIYAMLVEINGSLVEVHRIVQTTAENQAQPASGAEPIRQGSGRLDTVGSLAAAAQLGGHQHLLHVLVQRASPKGFSVAGGQVIGRRLEPYPVSKPTTQQATRLFDPAGRVCGLVFDKALNCVWDFDDNERYGFVLLSRALRDESCATSSVLGVVESGGGVRPVLVGSEAAGPDEDNWDILFVLLVEWQGRSKSCCQRLAMCQMSASAWEAARPQKSYIRLG